MRWLRCSRLDREGRKKVAAKRQEGAGRQPCRWPAMALVVVVVEQAKVPLGMVVLVSGRLTVIEGWASM